MGKLALTGDSRTRSRLADLAVAGGGGGFNVVTDIPWSHLYYAGGPAFVALGLSNGASMAAVNWPDEIAANAANLTGGSGVYRSADAAFNSKPCVEMPGSGNGKMHTGTVGAGAQVALPFSIIVIYQISPATATKYIIDGANAGGSGNRVLYRITAGPVWSLFMGTDRTGGTPSAGIKTARIYAISGNDVLTVDGSTVISGVDAGGNTWQGMTWSPTTVEFNGRGAFCGVYSGDITGHGNWSAFQSWVTSTYGVTIS